MLIILLTLIFGGAIVWLFTLIGLSLWFLFLWVPVGIILGFALLLVLLYLYTFFIGQHTKNNHFLKHLLLRSCCKCVYIFMNIKVKVVGRENIPDETFVIYSNHKSDLDPVMIYYYVHRRPISIVGKKSLFENHIMKLITKTFEAIPVNRENDREAAKSMINAINLVKEGVNMIIFPEGGIKSRDVEEMVDLKAGAYKLAMKPKATILPITLVGTSQTAKQPFYKRKKVTLIIEKPIKAESYEGLNTRDVGMMVEGIINSRIKEYEEKNI